ncbi:sodium-independent sulfate anion transporter-like [Diorhabda carinulata]|uniref:sodium-independent sulfate anion transporter-like n=1 Tax=Diorhabda carinulata TaxID=1163345 RepID=UPI0025A1C7A6|nr:sodium-independent sulfate anion transporter-like [Diorhabda carinulata]
MLCKKYLLRKLPFLKWSRQYSLDTGINDFVGGVTVGLTLIPQAIAFAIIAGLEPQNGLYAALCGGYIYAFFGTVPEMSVAPTAILSLLCEAYIKPVSFGRVEAAALLAFLSGSIQVIFGILQFGLLTNFVSSPVVSAFTSAAALTIASSQIKNILGLKFDAGHNFFKLWKNILAHIYQCRLWDSVLGIMCCIILLLLRVKYLFIAFSKFVNCQTICCKLKAYAAPLFEAPGDIKQSIRKKIFYILTIARNGLVVITSAALAYSLENHGLEPFQLTGSVEATLPTVSFSFFHIEEQNKTFSFGDIMSEIGAGVIFIPFLDMLAIVGIGRAFAQGKVLDVSQEMFAIGLCNLVSSLLQGYPVNGSFSRAAVARASGVRTPFCGVYTAILVLLSITLLSPYFPYIPKATLAAVIICAVTFMIDLKIIYIIWKVNRLDLIPFSATLISCLLFGLEIGILVGVLVDLLKFLVFYSYPKIMMDTKLIDLESTCLTLTPTSSVFYFSSEYVRSKVLEESSSNEIIKVVIDWSRIEEVDYTTALCFKELVQDLRSNNKEVLFINLNEKIENKLMTVFGDIKNIPFDNQNS